MVLKKIHIIVRHSFFMALHVVWSVLLWVLTTDTKLPTRWKYFTAKSEKSISVVLEDKTHSKKDHTRWKAMEKWNIFVMFEVTWPIGEMWAPISIHMNITWGSLHLIRGRSFVTVQTINSKVYHNAPIFDKCQVPQWLFHVYFNPL